MEILELCQFQSANVLAGRSVSSLFIAYAILCYFIKRPVFLLAFLLPELMINLSLFDKVPEWSISAIEFSLYTYAFEKCLATKSKIACFIMCYTSFMFGLDSYYYGVNGIYGARETAIYQNVGFIGTCSHIFLIYTLIPFRRIWDGLRGCIGSFVRLSGDSAYMFICWYNAGKTQ